MRLSIYVHSIRNNAFYGNIYVRYNKAAILDADSAKVELTSTSPPLELTKVHKTELEFANGFTSLERAMDSNELLQLLSERAVQLEVVHKDRSAGGLVKGTATVRLSALKSVKFVKADDSYVRVHDCYYAIHCADDGDELGELRVKLFLEDFGPADASLQRER